MMETKIPQSSKFFWNVVLRDDLKWNCKLDKHRDGNRHIPMSQAADRLWCGLAMVRSFKSSRLSGVISFSVEEIAWAPHSRLIITYVFP